MKLTKLIPCLLFVFVGSVFVHASFIMDIRAAATPEAILALINEQATTIASAPTATKVQFCAAKELHYLKSNDKATFAEGFAIYTKTAKELNIEAQAAVSSYGFAMVHPYWYGKLNTALIQEMLAYVGTLDTVSASQYAELGRIHAFVLKDKDKGVEMLQKAGAFGLQDLIRVYTESGESSKAIDMYYAAVKNETITPEHAASMFPTIWSLQIKGFKTAEERAAAKFELQKLIDQYTNKLYSDSKVEPEKSPWRKVLILWTASSK